MTSANSFHQPLCANCQNPGGSACASCRLVTYCSKACQTTHWNTHKHDCKSPLGKRSWVPAWAVDGNELDEGGKNSAFNRKYLFGNTPALDLLNLQHNEGSHFGGDLKVLFAASGDMRNVVQIVAILPDAYDGTLLLAINDLDLDIVARNLIMLHLALHIEGLEQAVQSIIHIWYSASIRPADARLLTHVVYPMIEETAPPDHSKPRRGKRLSDIEVQFELHNIDLMHLQEVYSPGAFDRIATTNVCDNCYLGTDRTLSALSHLLQKRIAKPNATILKSYMTAINEVVYSRDGDARTRAEVKAMSPYVPALNERCPRDDLLVDIVDRATAYVRDCERSFDEFAETSCLLNHLNIKQIHNIAEKWPTRLKMSPGQEGWEQEFVVALESMAPPTSRYVEWEKFS